MKYKMCLLLGLISLFSGPIAQAQQVQDDDMTFKNEEPPVTPFNYDTNSMMFKNEEPRVIPFGSDDDQDRPPTQDEIRNAAVQACEKVWIDPKNHVYHVKPSLLYGSSRDGRLMCKTLAIILHYKKAPLKMKRDDSIFNAIAGDDS